MTEQATAGSGLELVLTRDANRITVAGDVRTHGDRDQLKYAVEQLLTTAGEELAEVILDFGAAKYLDIAMLTSALGLARRCVDVGKTLALEGLNEEQLHMLRATHLDQVLRRYRTRIGGLDA